MCWVIIQKAGERRPQVVLKTAFAYLESVGQRLRSVPFDGAREVQGPFPSRRAAEDGLAVSRLA